MKEIKDLKKDINDLKNFEEEFGGKIENIVNDMAIRKFQRKKI